MLGKTCMIRATLRRCGLVQSWISGQSFRRLSTVQSHSRLHSGIPTCSMLTSRRPSRCFCSTTAGSKALSGIRVLDLSRLLPGPFATQLLADMGAEVIKVEEPVKGDYLRFVEPLCADGNSAIFHALNRGKKSITLDLKELADKQKFLSLLATADVLVESFRPGVLGKLGLAPDWLRREFPSLVLCSISGYGQTGGHSLRAGHDLNYVARAGLSHLGKPPLTLPTTQVADIGGGAWPAAFQILAAIHLRSKDPTQKGDFIDVSMTDGSYAFGLMPQSAANLRHARGEPVAVGEGNFVLNGVAAYNVYQCIDGWLSVGAFELKFWTKVCDAIGTPHLKSKGWLQGAASDKVIDEVSAVFMQKTAAEWKAVFEPLDACVEVIPRSELVSQSDEQLKHRCVDVTITVEGTEGKRDTFAVPKMPLTMRGVETLAKAGPKLGEHNQEILGDST